MENKELKPCPFCGAKAILLTQSRLYILEQNRGRRAVFCSNDDCGAVMYGRTDKEAIEWWNRRSNNET